MTIFKNDICPNLGAISLGTSILGIIAPLFIIAISRFGIGTSGKPYDMPGLTLFCITEIIAFGIGVAGRKSIYGQIGIVSSLVAMFGALFFTIIREYLNRGSNIMGF